MTQEEMRLLKNITEALLTCRRENLRTLARLKALEAMVRMAMPEDKQDDWHKRLGEQTKYIHQKLLESFEKDNPEFAATLDDRKSWEISDEV
jgi:hypothetical protein